MVVLERMKCSLLLPGVAAARGAGGQKR